VGLTRATDTRADKHARAKVHMFRFVLHSVQVQGNVHKVHIPRENVFVHVLSCTTEHAQTCTCARCAHSPEAEYIMLVSMTSGLTDGRSGDEGVSRRQG
jgi:hypothetical protein